MTTYLLTNLIKDPDNLPTVYTRHWHTTTTPDLAVRTDDFHGNMNMAHGCLGEVTFNLFIKGLNNKTQNKFNMIIFKLYKQIKSQKEYTYIELYIKYIHMSVKTNM